jgi:hypothetical protein
MSQFTHAWYHECGYISSPVSPKNDTRTFLCPDCNIPANIDHDVRCQLLPLIPMLCNCDECPDLAMANVHWPGQDTPMCSKHTKHAQQIASSMGFYLTFTPF